LALKSGKQIGHLKKEGITIGCEIELKSTFTRLIYTQTESNGGTLNRKKKFQVEFLDYIKINILDNKLFADISNLKKFEMNSQ
jgi:hypothetical protein